MDPVLQDSASAHAATFTLVLYLETRLEWNTLHDSTKRLGSYFRLEENEVL